MVWTVICLAWSSGCQKACCWWLTFRLVKCHFSISSVQNRSLLFVLLEFSYMLIHIWFYVACGNLSNLKPFLSSLLSPYSISVIASVHSRLLCLCICLNEQQMTTESLLFVQHSVSSGNWKEIRCKWPFIYRNIIALFVKGQTFWLPLILTCRLLVIEPVWIHCSGNWRVLCWATAIR